MNHELKKKKIIKKITTGNNKIKEKDDAKQTESR